MRFRKIRAAARRTVFAVLALCFCVSVNILPAGAQNQTERIFGSTRYETAMLCADRAMAATGAEGLESIIIASGTDFADALGGSYLSCEKNAPILLSKNGKNDAELLSYISQKLSPGGTVYILGGEKAVPLSVESGLSEYNVRRLAGADRYATNIAILTECGVAGGELLVCTGRDFADSLSASATGRPIMLVNSARGRLTDGQRAYLCSAGFEKITVLGGEAAVGKSLAEELSACAPVFRIGGADRYETSVLIAREYFADPEGVVLAYGRNYPDGLCGGLLGNRLGYPVVLAENSRADAARSYTLEKDISCGTVLGGSGLISEATVEYIFAREPRPERIVYGLSGRGRELEAYRFGTGENVFVLSFCVHGFEDEYDRDGKALVYVAEQLMAEIPGWDCEEWSIYVLPCCNPDGLNEGYTNNGPGRCTVSSYLEDGTLTFEKGADINRCFPTAWRANSDPRYYNGTAPLACAEAKALAEFIETVKGEGENYLVDVHGWYWQTLTSDGKNGALARAFNEKFPENSWKDVKGGMGYFSAYAASLGYDSCLFEIPSVAESFEEFTAGTYTRRFISVIKALVEG